MDTLTITKELDRTGRMITTFVVFDVVKELEALPEGAVLAVVTDDFEPFDHDLTAWCEVTGHRLLGTERERRGRRFLIEKGSPKTNESSLAMVVSAAGLEELLSPLGFALAAALEGMPVRLYFLGPAVRVLARSYKPHLQGWARPFSRFAAAEMTKMGHIPAQDKLRQLRVLGAEIYVCGPSMDHFKVRRDELIFDDLAIVEYLTFMKVMADSDVQLFT